MIVTGGATDVSCFFSMRLAATGADATGLTISDFDMQYTRIGESPTAKVDAVALAAANTAHTDNRGIEVDPTDQPGLYRFDWPDAAFAAGVREVGLSIKHASCITEHRSIEIDPFGAPAGASLAADIAAIEAQTDDIGAAGAGLTAIPLMTTQLTEAYAADGAAPTPAQALFLIQQMLTEMSISGTTMTVKKLDGATTAATLTLNDATTPTSVTRAT